MGREEIEQVLAQRYGQAGVPMISTVKDISMLKEGRAWKVHLGWKPGEMDAGTMDMYFGRTEKVSSER